MSRAVVSGYTAVGTTIAGGALMIAATARLAEAGALPLRGERVETLDFTAAACWLLGLALVVGGVVIVLATAVDAVVGRREQPEPPLQPEHPVHATPPQPTPLPADPLQSAPLPAPADSRTAALSSPS